MNGLPSFPHRSFRPLSSLHLRSISYSSTVALPSEFFFTVFLCEEKQTDRRRRSEGEFPLRSKQLSVLAQLASGDHHRRPRKVVYVCLTCLYIRHLFVQLRPFFCTTLFSRVCDSFFFLISSLLGKEKNFPSSFGRLSQRQKRKKKIRIILFKK